MTLSKAQRSKTEFPLLITVNQPLIVTNSSLVVITSWLVETALTTHSATLESVLMAPAEVELQLKHA